MNGDNIIEKKEEIYPIRTAERVKTTRDVNIPYFR